MTQLNKSIPVAYHISSNKCQGEEGGSLSSSENTSPVQTEQAALPLVPLAESEEEEEEEEEGC